jgi:hypothetical protein
VDASQAWPLAGHSARDESCFQPKRLLSPHDTRPPLIRNRKVTSVIDSMTMSAPKPRVNLVVLTNQKAREKRSRYVDYRMRLPPELSANCVVDTDTGELQGRRLEHREEAEKFYRGLG